MLITARSIDGEDRFSRGVVGHAQSRNLKDWEVLPPLTQTDSGFGHMEVFQVEEIDGVPTLLWCSGLIHMSESAQKKHNAGGMFSTTGESLLGPFDIENATRFPHDSIYAARVIKKDNEWFMIGFKYLENGEFVGELTDPIPVTSKPGIGLVPKV
jgi:beta-fructofuranosidase